jgi:hypothetical protein
VVVSKPPCSAELHRIWASRLVGITGTKPASRVYLHTPRGVACFEYFRDYAIPYECLPFSHSTKPFPPIRRIVRLPAPQLSLRFASRATHARTLLPAAMASVPFGFVLVRVRVRYHQDINGKQGIPTYPPGAWPASSVFIKNGSGVYYCSKRPFLLSALLC